MGAPTGTNNGSWRHGLRASALPKDCSYIDGQVRVFRRYVQNLLADRDGEVSFYQEAVLQSAVRHEQRCLLLARWLRLEGNHHGALPDDVEEKTEHVAETPTTNGKAKVTITKRKSLSVMERVGLLREMSVATEMRDRCLQRLSLDAKPDTDLWAALDADPVAQATATEATAAEDGKSTTQEPKAAESPLEPLDPAFPR